MDRPHPHSREIANGGLRIQVAVEGVARLEDDLLAGIYFDNGFDVRMPAVVPGTRLLVEVFAAIDGDARG
jgi:hypothetical protein